MIDVEKHLEYWTVNASQDFEFAEEILLNGRIEPGLFWLHLSIEKMLKAHVTKVTRKTPPKIHNLVILSEEAELSVTKDQLHLFARLNRFQIIARYPVDIDTTPPTKEALEILAQSKELFQWLKNQL